MKEKRTHSSHRKNSLFKDDPFAHLSKISQKKLLSIMVNGNELLLNERGISKELYELKEKIKKLQEEIGDLLDDFEDNKISKSDYLKGKKILRDQISEIREQIKELNNLKVDTTGFLLGAGGSKKFYDAGNGKALMLPNLDADTISKERWDRITHEESLIADMLSGHGLLAQTYESVIIKVEGANLQTVQTESFPSLMERGFQVRDYKNRHHLGNSMLFGEFSNINPPFIKELLKDINEDIKILLANQINLNGASFNLAICDTDQTNLSDKDTPILYSEANQVIRLYLYDFSIEHMSKLPSLYFPLLDDTGEPSHEEIAQNVDRYLKLAISSIKFAISNEEMRQLLAQVPESSVSESVKISSYMIDERIEAAFNEVKPEILEEIVSSLVDSLSPKSSVMKKKDS